MTVTFEHVMLKTFAFIWNIAWGSFLRKRPQRAAAKTSCLAQEKDQKFLQKVFDRMDTDGSGLVTFEDGAVGTRCAIG